MVKIFFLTKKNKHASYRDILEGTVARDMTGRENHNFFIIKVNYVDRNMISFRSSVHCQTVLHNKCFKSQSELFNVYPFPLKLKKMLVCFVITKLRY